MAIAVEHLYESCTCTDGMRDGLRCADCGGRGIVAKGTKPTGEAVPVPEGDTIETDDDLDNIDLKHLRERAKQLGLSAGGSKVDLVARIRDFNVVAAGEAQAAAEAGADAHTASEDGEETEESDAEDDAGGG
jgi:hypothetical protein